MEAIKKALDEKATIILEKEKRELVEYLSRNKIARNMKIIFSEGVKSESEDNPGKKEIIKPLLGEYGIFRYSQYGTGFTDLIKYESLEKRKEEIITEILNDTNNKIIENKEALKSGVSEEVKEEDVILEFLEKNIADYNRNINSTISAIHHGHISSNGTEISIYEKIVTSLSFIKSEYEAKQN